MNGLDRQDSSPSMAPETPEEREARQRFAAEVGTLFHAIKSIDFYTLLRVPLDAPREEIRASFFALSKRFHPDRAFEGSSPELLERLEVVFRRMSDAYSVLSNAVKREKYDRIRGIEERREALREREVRAVAAARERERARRGDSPPSPSSEPSEAEKKARSARSTLTPEAVAKHREWARERAARNLSRALGKAPTRK